MAGDNAVNIELAKITAAEKQAEFDHELSRMKVKWTSGIVAVVLAIVGAVGGWATGAFEYIIKKVKSDTDSYAATSSIERDYLDRYLDHALNEDLQYRRDFALYVARTAVTKDVRDNWQLFYVDIQKLLEADLKRRTEVSKQVDILRKDAEANAAKIAALETENRALSTRIEGS